MQAVIDTTVWEAALSAVRPQRAMSCAPCAMGVLWRRLLLFGAQFPNIVGDDLVPLAWSIPILMNYDTRIPVCKFLGAVYPLRDHNEREKIERAILAIHEIVSLEHRETAVRTRDRLLECIIDSEPITGEAKLLLAELRKKNAIASNELSMGMHGTASQVGENEFHAWRGVPVDPEQDPRIQELEKPVKEFADKYLNSIPSQLEVDAIFPSIRTLYEAIRNADSGTIKQLQKDLAWGYLAAACVRIAKMDDLSCIEEAGQFVIQRLLELSNHTIPTPDSDEDKRFEQSPSWGSPSPRIEAAEGLIMISSKSTCATAELLEAIQRLVSDPVPAVRYQIACHLIFLYSTMQNTMWEIIERMCRQESSRQVLHALLSTTLVRLAGSNPDRVVELTKSIYDRVTNGLGVEGVRAACVNIFVGLYLWQDVSSCREITLRIASSPLDNIKAAHNLLPHLRDPLAHGPTDPPDSNDDAVRHRALDLLKCLLSSARRAFQHLEEDHSQIPFDAWSEQDKVRIRSIAQLIDGIGREVYFASGAYDKERQVPNLTAMHTPQQMERFYHETAEILDELADSGFASITHHLMGMLEAFVPLDPRGVFLRIGQVLRAGQKGGYQYESLAIDQLVRLVERYFAEYRRLLQQDSECRETLIKILDIFISAGWPNAQRLSYRLDDIFH